MNGTILDKIIERKRGRVEALKESTDLDELRARAAEVRSGSTPNALRNAIADASRVSIIAEFKRASPSKGIINDQADPVETTIAYANGGAAAISVLTEEDFFKGSLEDLIRIRPAVNVPILRKDFVIDEYQIIEAAAAGADAILLIVAALDAGELRRLHAVADELGLDTIVEVHDLAELSVAAEIGASIIGVNNRNLKTFDVTLDTSRELIKHRPEGAIMIAESGITRADEIEQLRQLGYSAFLIGESLMRSIGRTDLLPLNAVAAEGR